MAGAALLALLMICGCGNTIVPLTYQPQLIETPSCDRTIKVLSFEDATQADGIGTNRKGRTLYPDMSLERWVTKAVRTQLRHQGCRVVTSANGADWQVSGTIKKAFVEELSSTSFRAALMLKAVLERSGQEVYAETFSATMEKRDLPWRDTDEELMRSLLEEIMSSLVPKLITRMQD
jgi:hypothetical protein